MSVYSVIGNVFRCIDLFIDSGLLMFIIILWDLVLILVLFYVFTCEEIGLESVVIC